MPSIFISTAHKNQDDEQVGTGDVDYAHTLAERLKELYQSSSGDEEVDCIKHLHDENAIYNYIEERKSKDPVLHIMLNLPNTGSAFTVEGLVKFKRKNNCKIVVTSIEFAKYNYFLKYQAFRYFNIADHVIFLDDNDKKEAEQCPKLGKISNASVIPVPATIPEILGLKPSEERGNNILFFGMIRQAKGIGYLLRLAELIKTTDLDSDSMRDIKIIIVGSIQEHIADNIFQLGRIMLAMYPEQKDNIEQLININGRLSPEESKKIIQRLKKELKSYEEKSLPKALPIELYLDVPKDELAVPFNKCKFSVLPLWRGGSIRNSSMTNMLTHDFITISFSGSATPQILETTGEYSGAMILLQKHEKDKNVFAKNVFDTLKSRLENPRINNLTYNSMRKLTNNVLSMKIIIQKHVDVYNSLQNSIAIKDIDTFKDSFSELDYMDIDKDSFRELDCYETVYSEYGIQFIKTIRSDAADYYDIFVGSILGEHKKPLRCDKKDLQKYKYKVGIRDNEVQVLEANEAGKFLPPQFLPEEKEGKSKKTSTSVISSKQQYLTGLFGDDIEGRTTGIIFFTESGGESEQDKQIVLPSLIFKNDAGTVGRTFYFASEKEAQDYIEKKGLHVTVWQLIDARVKEGDTIYNEVLSRLQWIPNDRRCHIGIFSNDLKDKLLAQLRAIDLKINTNAKYIPITFYKKDNKDRPFSGYLLEHRQKDVKDGLSLSDDGENNIIKSMALLIKKYEESQLSNSIVFNDEEREKCFTVLVNFKLTRKTIIKFIMLMCAGGECSDADKKALETNSRQEDASEGVILKYLNIILEKTTTSNLEIVKQLLRISTFLNISNKDVVLKYLNGAIEKVTDLNLEIVTQLLEAINLIGNGDLKLEYLKIILAKITGLKEAKNINYPIIINKFCIFVASVVDLLNPKSMELLESILSTITNSNSDAHEKLSEATPVCEDAREDVILKYLNSIIEKVTDLNPDIIKQLLNNSTLWKTSNKDVVIKYLNSIAGKITDLNLEIVKQLLEAINLIGNGDLKLEYLKIILAKITGLKEAKNINYPIIINKFCIFVASVVDLLNPKSRELLESILSTITNSNLDVHEKLSEATPVCDDASEGVILKYLNGIIEKVTDLNPDIVKQLLKNSTLWNISNKDVVIKYLNSIVGKVTDFNPEVVSQLLEATYLIDNIDLRLAYSSSIVEKVTDLNLEVLNQLLKVIYLIDNIDLRLAYSSSIVEKITDLNLEVLNQLLQYTYLFESEDAKLSYLGNILNKIMDLNTDFTPEVVRQLLEAFMLKANEDSKLKYFKSILEKIKNFSPEVVKQLLETVTCYANEDSKLKYLKIILGKIVELNPELNLEIFKKLLENMWRHTNEAAKLAYFKSILEKIQNFSPDVVKQLLESVLFCANKDSKLEYLKRILEKIKNFSPDVVRQLLEAVLRYANEDSKLEYFKSILEKIQNFSTDVVKQLLESVLHYANEDSKLEYLKSILERVAKLNPEDVRQLLKAIPFYANEDSKLEYLKSILEKIKNFSPEDAKQLLKDIPHPYITADSKLEYLKSILERVAELNLEDVKQLLEAVPLARYTNEDLKLEYLKSILEKIKNLSPEDVNQLLKAACLFNSEDVTVIYLEKLLNKITDLNPELNPEIFKKLLENMWRHTNEAAKLAYFKSILEKIKNFSPNIVKRLLETVPRYVNEYFKLEYFKSILEIVAELNPENVEQFLESVPRHANEDSKLEYFKSILEKMKNFSPDVVKQFLESVPRYVNEDLKLVYLKSILEKVAELNLEYVKQLLEAVPRYANKDSKLEYFKSILEKIKNFSSDVVKQLLEAVSWYSNEGLMSEYLKIILEKITGLNPELNPEIFKKLLNNMWCHTNEDSKLEYFKSILEKMKNFSPDVVKQLLEAIPRYANEDLKLVYFKSILGEVAKLSRLVKLKLTDVDDNSIKLFIVFLCNLNVKLQEKIELVKKFKSSNILKVIEIIKEQEFKTATYDSWEKQQLNKFLDEISEELTTKRKRENSPPSLMFSSKRKRENSQPSFDQPLKKKRKLDL